jgi:predicted RNA-binding protein (virulence factor B family)
MEKPEGVKIAHTIKAGETNRLVVTRITPHGVILRNHNGDEEVLLPAAYVTEAMGQVQAVVEVFVYTDSEDRPVATTQRPVAMLGELAFVDVVDVHPYGTFVCWGLPKDLLVPLSQQKSHLRIGDRIVIRVELDEQTGRLYGTQRIGRGFEPARGMVPSQKLEALVIAQTPMGYKIVVDHRYEGMLYANEIFEPISVGGLRAVYLKQIRKDGKMDCSLQPIGRQAKTQSAEQGILDALTQAGGRLGVTSKSVPEVIRSHFGLSKKQFKAGLRALASANKIVLSDNGIKLV